MSKWKCDICGTEFENFHAQGFDNKIYCPLCYFKKENQELKEQLEVGKEQYNDLVEEKEKIQEQLSSNTLQFENQQKEFIEWLEDKINFWKDKIFENAITENDWTLTLWRNKLGILEESLSKYKEIIGVKDE